LSTENSIPLSVRINDVLPVYDIFLYDVGFPVFLYDGFGELILSP